MVCRRCVIVLFLASVLVLIAFSSSSAGVADRVSLHMISPSGPPMNRSNDGETIYINATDGVTYGSTRTCTVIDGEGNDYTVVLHDNGAHPDPVANDGYYSGIFTIYNVIVPGVPGVKIHLNDTENATVFVDLDSGGDGDFAVVQAVYDPFSVFLVDVVESSPNIYFDRTSEVLYFSNDQPMSDSVTLVLEDNKPSAWNKSCLGETAFGDQPEDSDYTDLVWNLTYIIDLNETCDGNITITITDRANYRATYNLTVVLDNDPPQIEGLMIKNFPDYVGPPHGQDSPLFEWWRPAHLTSGLNVTWSAVDNRSGLQSALLDWNSTLDDQDQMGIDCGLDGFEIVENLTDDLSCMINVTVTITDRVGNSRSSMITIAFDSDPPTPTIHSILEDSPHLAYNGTTLLYSNNQNMFARLEIRLTDDESGSGTNISKGEEAFGEAPVDDDYGDGFWNIVYHISRGERVNPPLTITVYDNVGNIATVDIPVILDNTPPVLTCSASEYSPYLHIDTVIYFGKSMSSVQYVVFNGTASDNIALDNMTFSEEPNLAQSPSSPLQLSGTIDLWSAAYGFDSQSTQGDGTITITLYDLVGNFDRVQYDYVRDSDPPNTFLSNYADGQPITDTSSRIDESTDPWSLVLTAVITDSLLPLYSVTVVVDGDIARQDLMPSGDVFEISNASLNASGWHTIRWVSKDLVNNSANVMTSILRVPGTVSRYRVSQVLATTRLLDVNFDEGFMAIVDVITNSTVWASFMLYTVNPAGTDAPGNYTLFHFFDLAVNDTSNFTSAYLRIYYTDLEMSTCNITEDDLIGIARWDTEWHWFTSSGLNTVNQNVGGVIYSGYMDLDLDSLFSSTNQMGLAAWRFRVRFVRGLCTHRQEVFQSRLGRNYTAEFTVVMENIGPGSDDYYLNASGPSDWEITWFKGRSVKSYITGMYSGHRKTFTLYVSIPEDAVNISSGTAGLGREYQIVVTVQSLGDTWSRLNEARNDTIILSALIRRTDLSIGRVAFSSLSAIAGQNVTFYCFIENLGNWTSTNVTVWIYHISPGDPYPLGSYILTSAELPPHGGYWISVDLTVDDAGTHTFKVNITYLSDELDSNPNVIEKSIEFIEKKAEASTHFRIEPMILLWVLLSLTSLRRRVVC